MRHLSVWATRHKQLAIFIIIIANIYLFICMMMLAGQLQQQQQFIQPLAVIAGIAGFTGLAILFSLVKKRRRISVTTVAGYALVRARYAAVLIASLLVVFAFFYYQWHIPTGSQGVVYSSQPKSAVKNVKPDYSMYTNKDLYYKDLASYFHTLSKKELRQEYRYYRKLHKQHDSSGGDTGLIILVILGALVLAYLVLALACDVSCAGSDAGAVAIAVVGLAGIIWGSIALIKSIKRRRARLEEQQSSK